MNLKEYMDKYKLSQERFAKKVGLKRGTIGTYVRYERKPNGRNAQRIFLATKGEVSYAEIFGHKYVVVPKKEPEPKVETYSENIKLCI